MNPIAEQLIHNLRHDDFTQEHFSIRTWNGKRTCGTVGCIGGTALAMAGLWKPLMNSQGREFLSEPQFLHESNFSKDFVTASKEVLGIEELQTAKDLFIPYDFWWNRINDFGINYDYLPTQARPSKDHVEEMKQWAGSYEEFHEKEIPPQVAARALELVTKDEIPYCDWKRAFEEA